MEVLDLKGTNSLTAQRAFLDAFWDEFGLNGNKRHRSARGRQTTLERLKMIGDMVVLRKNTPAKTARARKGFNAVKVHRHRLESHGFCFACGKPATARHHIIWLRNGGLNSKRNIISLCSGCHAYIHPWLAKGV